MSTELSINSVAANPAHINPQVKTDQATAAPQADQSAQQSVAKAKTDTVTVSKAALHMTSKAAAAAATLTGAALARSLKERGMPLSQIAVTMGLSPDAAARLLGVQVAKSTSQAKPTVTTPPKPLQVAASAAQSYSPAEEAKESPAAKAQESLQGKK
jgi:FtsZ-interacting cell division protein ZipA